MRTQCLVDHRAHLGALCLGSLRMLQGCLRSRLRLSDGFGRGAELFTYLARGATKLRLKCNYCRVHALFLADTYSAQR